MDLAVKKLVFSTGLCMSFLVGGTLSTWAAGLDNVETVQQNKKKVTGTIVDQTGEPVIGANVLEVGTTNGTITDFDGKFSLEVGPNAKLSVSFIGYKEQTIAVGNQSNLRVVLSEDTELLDEVVVVGSVYRRRNW